jgi:uncharacterized protein
VRERDEGQGQQEAATWSALQPEAALTVVKLAPDGSEAARYRGDVVGHCQDTWLLVQATWTHRRIELGGLSFCPGDELLEWFSPRHPYNAFAVSSPQDHFKGWYANVAHPARLDFTMEAPVLYWHDLYLDLVGLPDGSFTVHDDDELLASGLAEANPELQAGILAARSELIRRFHHQLPPFADASQMTPSQFRNQLNLLTR